MSPISTSSENRAKFGINLGFDTFDLEHDVTLSSDRNIIDTEFRVITIAPIFAYSVNNNIDFYVKAGVTLWDADLESKDLSMSYSLDGEDFIFGLGATYQSHNGAYSGIEISKADFSDSGFDVDTVMISIKFGYTFGLNSAR
ncbi:outer membrane beta-barrel protein [Vibrio fluminensis]|uniref:outer membrane beta-barrel protein n=1 Tax=Vibrio fluminensis TaxID=2783614 RepID=UPI0018896D87|nr:outer membrane beta-barrel protein [Vibrio fluminensis]